MHREFIEIETKLLIKSITFYYIIAKKQIIIFSCIYSIWFLCYLQKIIQIIHLLKVIGIRSEKHDNVFYYSSIDMYKPNNVENIFVKMTGIIFSFTFQADIFVYLRHDENASLKVTSRIRVIKWTEQNPNLAPQPV